MGIRGTLLAIASLTPLGSLAEESSAGEHHARWQAAAIDDYQFAYQKFCECHKEAPAETVVAVRAGAIADVRLRRPGQTADILIEARNHQWYWTVEDLFSLIETASMGEALVRVAYDAEMGYPLRIYIDYDRAMVGEEVDIRVTRFEGS